MIIIVESSYEKIIMRRNLDKLRIRILDDLKSFKENKQILRMSMMACSVIYGSCVNFLEMTILNHLF